METVDLMVQTYTNDHVIELTTSILKMKEGQSKEKEDKASFIIQNVLVPSTGHSSTQGASPLSPEGKSQHQLWKS